MTFYCSEGHSWATTLKSLRQGRGCPTCANNIKLTKEKVNKDLEHRGIVLIGEYEGSQVKTTFKCSNNHTWEAVPNNVRNNKTECPHCSSNNWSDKGFIYLLTSSQGIKIGISYNPEKRLKLIAKSSNILDLQLYGKYIIGDGSRAEAYALEQMVHIQLQEFNCNYFGFEGATEFFNIPVEQAESLLLSNGAIKQCQ